MASTRTVQSRQQLEPLTGIDFFRLSKDIRLMVYDTLFAQVLLITLRLERQPSNFVPVLNQPLTMSNFSIRKPFYDEDSTPQRATGIDLLYVNKSIREEALPFFYTSSVFSFFQPELYEHFMKAIPARYRPLIRHVALDIGAHWDGVAVNNPIDPINGAPVPIRRNVFRTGLPEKEYQRLFTLEAFQQGWQDILRLTPNLHCLEARMWSCPRTHSSLDSWMWDVDANLVAVRDHVAAMQRLQDRLVTRADVQNPQNIVQEKCVLSWAESTAVCPTLVPGVVMVGLPYPMAGDFARAVNALAPNMRSTLKFGVVCLNMSLRRQGGGESTGRHLGGVDRLCRMLNGILESATRIIVFGEMTSWG